jgi:hypothetical protein
MATIGSKVTKFVYNQGSYFFSEGKKRKLTNKVRICKIKQGFILLAEG